MKNTQDDFESMSWHDSCINSMTLKNPDKEYDFDFVLDITHVSWFSDDNQTVKLVTRPAILIFNNVDKLSIDIVINYKESIIIDQINREEIIEKPMKNKIKHYKWCISVQSISKRNNNIIFESPKFCCVFKELN